MLVISIITKIFTRASTLLQDWTGQIWIHSWWFCSWETSFLIPVSPSAKMQTVLNVRWNVITVQLLTPAPSLFPLDSSELLGSGKSCESLPLWVFSVSTTDNTELNIHISNHLLTAGQNNYPQCAPSQHLNEHVLSKRGTESDCIHLTHLQSKQSLSYIPKINRPRKVFSNQVSLMNPGCAMHRLNVSKKSWQRKAARHF